MAAFHRHSHTARAVGQLPAVTDGGDVGAASQLGGRSTAGSRWDLVGAYALGMDDEQLRRTIEAAVAAEIVGMFGPREWTDLASALLATGRDDAELVDLAILRSPVSGWTTDPIVAALRERLPQIQLGTEAATELFARVLADDLRVRPADVTSPMIRMLARTAPPDFSSDLAANCYGVEEYLDCNCVAHVDPIWDRGLEELPTCGLPPSIATLIAARARSTLPTEQPPHRH